MNRFKGTPGPWEMEADTCNGIEVVTSDQEYVCEVIANNDSDLLTKMEWNNARLIAAAPDLLEALISCKNAMEHGDPNEETTRQVWDRIIFDAHAAISKALGEEVTNG